MRTTISLVCLTLAACGQRSAFVDHSTPLNAARSFVEAGRVGDTDAARASLVAAERNQDISCDYSEIGHYELELVQEFDEDHVVVMLRTGPIESPLACQREGGRWGVSLSATLHLMQQQMSGATGAAPR